MCPDERFERRGRWRARTVLGLLIVAWGALALLDNLGILGGRDLMRTFWPVLVIGWGLVRLTMGEPHGRWIGAAAATAGVALLGNTLEWWHVRITVLWPLFVIALGIHVMTRRGHRRARLVRVDVSRQLSSDGADRSLADAPDPVAAT